MNNPTTIVASLLPLSIVTDLGRTDNSSNEASSQSQIQNERNFTQSISIALDA